MRCHFKVMIAMLMVFFSLQLATGQLPLTGDGGLGGLTGKDGRPDPLTLLHNASVKKELRLTKDQADKVDDAVWEALAKVLDSDQLKRLKQIDLQQRDYLAFGDPGLQATLMLTKQQKDNIKIILADADKELMSLLEGIKTALASGPAGLLKAGLQGIPERAASIRKEAKERCTEVLSSDQKRVWEELVGDDFKMEVPKLDFGDLLNKGKKKKGG